MACWTLSSGAALLPQPGLLKEVWCGGNTPSLGSPVADSKCCYLSLSGGNTQSNCHVERCSQPHCGDAGSRGQQTEALELPGANTAWLLEGELSTQLQAMTLNERLLACTVPK